MSDVKWIKIITNIFDDEKILLIDSLPDRDAVIVIWFKILTLAGKCNNNGILTINDKIAYTDEMLATIFNRPLNTIRLALETFRSFGMIEMTDHYIMVKNWEKHQNIDGLDKIREQGKLRQQRYRDKQRITTSNVTSRYSNGTEEELEKEREVEEDIKNNTAAQKPRKTYIDTISEFTTNIQLRESLKDYVEMRKKTKGFTIKALELNLSKLVTMNYNDKQMIEVVNNSIMNSWKGLFPLKDNDNKYNYKSINTLKLPKEVKADYDKEAILRRIHENEIKTNRS